MKNTSDNKVFHSWMLRGVAAALLVSLIVFGGSLLVSANTEGGANLDADQRIVTVFDNGERKTIVTKSNSVGEALAQSGIEIDTHDVVEPAIETKFDTTDYTVNVYRARPVLVEDGMQREWVMSPALSAREIAAEAQLEDDLRTEDIVTFSDDIEAAVNGISAMVSIDRAVEIHVGLYGKGDVFFTQSESVSGFLKERDITLGPDDTLSVPADTKISEGLAFEVWRNGVQTITEEQEIDFPVRSIRDADKDVGFKEVKTPGAKGKRSVTYEISMKNGVEESRREIQSVVIEEPSEEVVVVGAKPSFSGDFQGALAKLRSCEGGYNSWNPAGPYYGAYQFDQRTWSSVTDAPYGSATPEQQDDAAWKLYQRRGWQPWPNCGASLPDIYR